MVEEHRFTPEPAQPKRKLNKIKTGVVTSKPVRELSFGGGGGGGSSSGGGGAAEGDATILLKEWQRLPKQLLQDRPSGRVRTPLEHSCICAMDETILRCCC